MADKLNGILISEILADNAGSRAVDTDGDGTTNKTDEYIELQNATGSPISLDGYELWSDKGGLLYSFGPGDEIASGGTATVVGNYSGGSIPDGYYDAGVSEGTNWLPDGEGPKFETIYLVDTSTGDYIRLSYGNPPPTPNPPSGFPGTTQVGAGEDFDSNAPNARAFIRDANGDLIEGDPSPGVPGVPCFTAGTLIATRCGTVPVEDLRPGDDVFTRDAGYKRILAVRKTHLSRMVQKRLAWLCPVVLPAGLFGDHTKLTLSPSHRVLFCGARVALLTGESEVLLSAAQCLDTTDATQVAPGADLTYYHLLCRDHQIIWANGLWVESLYLGDVAQAVLDDRHQWDVLSGVDLADLAHDQPARRMLTGFEATCVLSGLGARRLAAVG